MPLTGVQPASATVNDPRWVSLTKRDPAADGTFYYSVSTTGVYCRPSCAARLARPEHVVFHQSREDAERAGFRPCKRCKPDQPALAQQRGAVVAEICRFIEAAEELPKLEQLAEQAGMSSFHFHRIFKAATGLTPRAYGKARRAERMRKELQSSDSITEAIYEVGYSSSGTFYGESSQVLGMTPSRFRQGGAQVDIRFAVGECSLGSILVAKSDRGVCAILLGEDPSALVRDLQNKFPEANLTGADTEFEDIVSKVVGLVEAPEIGLDLPLDIRGTAFQQRVWQALAEIPAGSTASYTEIASRIGLPKSVRAVARACAANNLAVAIPCHRVVRTNGALAGYRWGVERKRALLEREQHTTEGQ